MSERDRDTYRQTLTSPVWKEHSRVKLNVVWIKHTSEESRADVLWATNVSAVGAGVVLGVELKA